MTELPLRDIHLPDPISWWPLAPGWWLALGLIILLISLTVFLVKLYFKPTLRKEAAKALEAIERSFLDNGDAAQCLTDLSAFLRRAVLSQKLSTHSAGVTGTAWLALLDQSLDTPEFSQGAGQILLTGPYQSKVKHEDVAQLLQLCRQWVQRL